MIWDPKFIGSLCKKCWIYSMNFSDFTWKQLRRFLTLRNCHFGNFQGTEFLFWWLIAIFHHRKYLISEPQKMSKWQFLMSRTIKLISRKNLNCKKSENFHNLCGKTRNSFTRKNISINQFFSVVSIENTRCFHEIFDIRVNFRNFHTVTYLLKLHFWW